MKKDFKKERQNLSRRGFLGTMGLASATLTIVPSNVLAGRGIPQPSDMINVAGIGIGARGASNLQGIADPDVPIVRPQRSNTGQPYTAQQLAEQAARQQQQQQQRQQQPQQQQQAAQQQRAPKRLGNIYALCDVDLDFSAHVIKGYPKAKVYQDFRKMLDTEKEIDAITIGTPDHMHAPIAAYAMKMGKHVYVEKPICKTVFESRELRRIAKEMNVVTQMGNQGHATEGTRQTVEMVQSGAVGKITRVDAYTGAPSWPQGDLQRPAEYPYHLPWIGIYGWVALLSNHITLIYAISTGADYKITEPGQWETGARIFLTLLFGLLSLNTPQKSMLVRPVSVTNSGRHANSLHMSSPRESQSSRNTDLV